MSKVGFYLLHGLEVRHFLLSGLLELISKENEVVLFIGKQVDSAYLNEYLKTYNVNLVALPVLENEKTGTWVEAVIRSIRNARKRNLHLGMYNHSKKNSRGNKFTDFVKGNNLTHFFSDKLGRKFLNKQNYSPILFDFINEQKISKLYVVDYGSILSKQLISTCNSKNIEINVFINSLKAVFIDDFIPFSLHKFNTWNETQRQLYIAANPGINKLSIVATGLPYHNFLRYVDVDKIKRVKEKYNLTLARPVIVYSMIFEKIFTAEHLIIEKINNFFIKEFHISKRPQLVIRRNPFEENDYGIKYLSSLENIIIASHNWERDLSKAWTIQRLEGEFEWRALLQLSSLSMNIPSMSTIDSLLCGTPVINIAFDENEKENLLIPHILYAPFVDEFGKSNFVKTYASFESFKIAFSEILLLKVNTTIKNIQNSIDIVKSELAKFI